METLIRCPWAEKSELEKAYHDTEWGVPVHDDKTSFKMLILEGMQAGLSWATILKKRENRCAAFDDFDPAIIKDYDETKCEALMHTDGIIKNRLKIRAAVTNAHAYYKLCEEFGSLDAYLWRAVNNTPIINTWKTMEEVPAKTELSDRISTDLKKRGFKFVGSTIIYAFMQSLGMVNDHLISCSFKNNNHLTKN